MMSAHQAAVNLIVSAAQSDAPGTERVELLGGLSDNIFAAVAPDMVRLGWSVFPQERTGRRGPALVYGQAIRWAAEHDLANKPPAPDALKL